MYLSQLTLDPSDRRAASWVEQVYRVHQRLLLAWPDGAVTSGEGETRMLFRIDWPKHPSQPTRILVQAPLEADWERCFDDLPILAQPAAQKAFAPRPRAGQRLRFRLRANPTRRVASPRAPDDKTPRPRGQRVDLRRDYEQLDWLDRQARGDGCRELGGFSFLGRREYRIKDPATGKWLELDLPDLVVSDLGAVRSRRRPNGAEPAPMVHRLVDFEGLLTVTDPDRFAATLARGIGPAKAFGCGLLSIAPAP